MANLTNYEKAPIVVTTAGGANVPAYQLEVIEETNVVDIAVQGDVQYVVAKSAGTATLNVTAGGSSGSLLVTVTAAPLTVTLGPVEPQ